MVNKIGFVCFYGKTMVNKMGFVRCHGKTLVNNMGFVRLIRQSMFGCDLCLVVTDSAS